MIPNCWCRVLDVRDKTAESEGLSTLKQVYQHNFGVRPVQGTLGMHNYVPHKAWKVICRIIFVLESNHFAPGGLSRARTNNSCTADAMTTKKLDQYGASLWTMSPPCQVRPSMPSLLSAST